MTEEITAKKDSAETVHINHPTSSYGVFCFNSQGDLFLNSDWGFYGYAWRAYGGNFKEFLKKVNADYVVNKFFINWNNEMPKDAKKRWKRVEPHLTNLVNVFIEEINK